MRHFTDPILRIERDIDVAKRIRRQRKSRGESTDDIDEQLQDLKDQHANLNQGKTHEDR